MRVVRTILAGGSGTKRYLEQWGEMLYAVRYRDDAARGKVLTTVELVVDERPKLGKNRQQRGYLSVRERTRVQIPVAYEDDALRETLKRAGAQWNGKSKAWITTYRVAVSLGLKDRIRSFE